MRPFIIVLCSQCEFKDSKIVDSLSRDDMAGIADMMVAHRELTKHRRFRVAIE